ncbi:MAG: hypothetical protein ABSF71_35465 [Terriglobia bacterium]|jgi:hypothetical protein
MEESDKKGQARGWRKFLMRWPNTSPLASLLVADSFRCAVYFAVKVAHAPGLLGTEQYGVFAAAGMVSITGNLARIVDSDGVGKRETGAGRS